MRLPRPGLRVAGLRAMLAAAVCLAGCLALPAGALADGDPGSDVLVYQSLFVLPDAGISAASQVSLGNLLQRTVSGGSPVRVAIISSPSDLGSVTAAWQRPRAYAKFLGYELSQAYSGRLLVVMPNGFGFNWPGHSTAAAYAALSHLGAPGAGGAALARAATAGVLALAHATGVHLASSGASGSAGAGAVSSATGGSLPGYAPQASSSTRALAFAVLVGLALLILVVRFVLLPRRAALVAWARGEDRRGQRPRAGVLAVSVLPVLVAVPVFFALKPSAPSLGTLANNPVLDQGTTYDQPAPEFKLTDQFGKQVSLRQFRGKVVILSFDDSECTTVCPLTTTAMLDAKAMLGAAAPNVQLLGIDANPRATSIEDVASYTRLHGMLGAWDFLTGELHSLTKVWHDYSIDHEITQNLVDHTPAIFVISPQGRIRKLFLTAQSYAAVPQLGQLLAQTAAALLPGHPKVDSHLSYGHIPGIYPTQTVSLPRFGGGRVSLGPGRARLLLFFDTWDRQVTDLATGLAQLNSYQTLAIEHGLPEVTAVDEAAVEPGGVLGPFLDSLRLPPIYPTVLDQTGRLADGYEVAGEPTLVLVDRYGHIALNQTISGLKWPSARALAASVRSALAKVPTSPNAVAGGLKGSPSALAALHRQGSRVLPGGWTALVKRLHTLLGHPVVINVWASWCEPCQAEFKLFQTAAAQYGKSVAFVGVDTNDSPSDAAAFLRQHPISYPSYAVENNSVLAPMAQLEGTPTTLFISASGHVIHVHNGPYEAQGTLDNDIATYAFNAGA